MRYDLGMRSPASIAAALLLTVTGSLAQAQDGKTPKPTKTPAAPAGESIRLSYIFSSLDGKTATYRIQNTLTQSKRVQGSSGKAKEREQGSGKAVAQTRQTYELSFEKGPRGLGKVGMTPRRIVARLTENDDKTSELRYDSSKKSTPPKQLAAAIGTLTAMLNKTARMTVTRIGAVRDIRGVKVSQRPAYQANFHEFPNRRLRVGEGWETLKKQPIPPFGKLHYFTTFRLVEVVPATPGKLEQRKIKAKITVTYEGIGPKANTRLRIKRQSGSGTLVFDSRGLLLEETLHSEVEYEIKAVAGTEIHSVTSHTKRWLSGLRETEKKTKK